MLFVLFHTFPTMLFLTCPQGIQSVFFPSITSVTLIFVNHMFGARIGRTERRKNRWRHIRKILKTCGYPNCALFKQENDIGQRERKKTTKAIIMLYFLTLLAYMWNTGWWFTNTESLWISRPITVSGTRFSTLKDQTPTQTPFYSSDLQNEQNKLLHKCMAPHSRDHSSKQNFSSLHTESKFTENKFTQEYTVLRCPNFFEYSKYLIFNFFCPKTVHKRIYKRWAENGTNH